MAMVASAGVGAGVLAVQIRSQTVLQSSAADLRARLISLGQSVSGLAQIVATVLTAEVGAVLIALEAKACMTAHVKALPRLYDELNSSHQCVHGSSSPRVGDRLGTSQRGL
jgi:uncharacterized RmlC-like cupin family protein